MQSDSGAHTDIRATPSEVCDSLTLLHNAEAFRHYLQRLLSEAHREVDILSSHLDPWLLGQTDIADQISRLARQHRQARVRVLIQDPTPLFGSFHPLVRLFQRLPSKIELRKLLQAPRKEQQAYVVIDRRALLLQHQEGQYEGFCNTDAAPEAQSLLEEFDELWQRQSSPISEFRQLAL